MMQYYQYRASGQQYDLERVTRPDPVAGPGRVIVRVHAASLNYRDLIHLQNKAGFKADGRVPLSDGAGEIVSVGPDVTDWKVGDRVMGCFFQTWQSGRFEMRHHGKALGGSADGMLTEMADLAADGVVAMPGHLSYEEAACLPCAGLTAWFSLFERGRLQPGDTVLALGTGGVSVFALQFASSFGCPVIITSSQDAKLERAKQLGATHTINYKSNPDWEKEVQRLTGKRGVDHVLEVGGGGTLGKSLASVAAGGHVALIGVLTGFNPPDASLFPMVSKNVTMSGIYVGSRADFVRMNAYISGAKLKPVIDRVFGFDQAADAFAYLDSGSHFGKVVIKIG